MRAHSALSVLYNPNVKQEENVKNKRYSSHKERDIKIGFKLSLVSIATCHTFIRPF